MAGPTTLPQRAAAPAAPVRSRAGSTNCAILTPSGALLARGDVRPREDGHVSEAYAVQITNVEPPGTLEALFYAKQPEVVLRVVDEAQITLRIDHIVGPPARRTYYLHAC